ncbi:MAG: ECF transporter S component [Clostridiaceae bacterium]|nr:ECF transporter S component [Clostridiaceae bacterium]MDY3071465.1 ECF transporter S component [Eubacteriales bacterium]MDY3285588.1 ECF transporter S component [Eubacteriales bacterium]MDY5015693.1 ECF transporter S component [Eubacteriales bacterium]
MQSKSVRRLVTLALLVAIAVALCLLVRFPIFAAAPWLEYDAGDIPVIFAAFLFGPWWALAVTFVLCVIQGLTVSASSGIIGIAMHFFATGSFVLVAGLLFRRFPKKVALSMLAGALTAIVMMIPLNLIFTPMYGTPIEAVRQMLFPVIVPFNAVKFGANAIIAYLLYKPMARFLAERRA